MRNKIFAESKTSHKWLRPMYTNLSYCHRHRRVDWWCNCQDEVRVANCGAIVVTMVQSSMKVSTLVPCGAANLI